jgi:hypothetical protein
MLGSSRDSAGSGLGNFEVGVYQFRQPIPFAFVVLPLVIIFIDPFMDLRPPIFDISQLPLVPQPFGDNCIPSTDTNTTEALS